MLQSRCSKERFERWPPHSIIDGTALPECIHGSFEVHRIPERDGGDHQIQTAGAIPLILIGTIPDLAQPMEEHRTR